jgi:hypothetical protein
MFGIRTTSASTPDDAAAVVFGILRGFLPVPAAFRGRWSVGFCHMCRGAGCRYTLLVYRLDSAYPNSYMGLGASGIYVPMFPGLAYVSAPLLPPTQCA